MCVKYNKRVGRGVKNPEGGGGDISFFYLTYYCSMFLGARLENPKINKREEGGRGGGS